jgi:hypothetical protein
MIGMAFQIKLPLAEQIKQIYIKDPNGLDRNK